MIHGVPAYHNPHTANPFPVIKTGVPAMRTGVPCNENRFFPVWKTSQGKSCSGPVLALYRITVCKKYSKNGAAGKIFGPSYFDPTLAETSCTELTLQYFRIPT